MRYWSSKPDGCDYAFDSVGIIVDKIVETMNKEIKVVVSKSHPEQSMLSSLTLLRLIAQEHRTNVVEVFSRKKFENLKETFYSWYENVSAKIPSKYREELLKTAKEEFQKYEQQVYG